MSIESLVARMREQFQAEPELMAWLEELRKDPNFVSAVARIELLADEESLRGEETTDELPSLMQRVLCRSLEDPEAPW